ncbi:nuclear fragile X mental retardation-interacting protein 1 [Coccinella septempunctata]|uniref:nuclear fragile X mental retardation-interacting protein 1 n=1 Tax=Coccinella septempunctata TaxID=41139 RepID=UPI001D088E9C|nr:nuclear fragile X mental retardation-interacting protein 1 [Coccinella septempunctata]
MNYPQENLGFYQRPFFNGKPSFSNSPNMIGSFSPRGLPSRGFPRRGGPISRPTLGQGPSFQDGMRPRYMMNRARPSSRQFGWDHNGSEGTFKPMDLTKPWVTETIKSEFAKKEELLTKAKSTKLQEDWAMFREQRNKCTNMYHSLQMEFNNQQECENMHLSEQYDAFDGKFAGNREENSVCTSSQVYILACDSCDRSFPSETAYNKHMSEHRVCGLDGCTLSAHEKIIEKHIQMQHSTGIFNKMKDLNSPENIAKWIEERKLKFPSKENIKRRHEQQEELWKKGIRIGERKNKFGQDKKRLVREDRVTFQKKRETFLQKREAKKDKFIQKLQPKITIDDKLDWNKNLPPFPGIGKLFQVEVEENFIISDEEDESIRQPTKIKDLVEENSSLAALMSYGSDYSDEDESKTEIEKEKSSSHEKIEVMKVDKNSDDEGPLEIKIEKTTEPTSTETKDEPIKKNSKRKMKKNQETKKKEVSKFPYQFKYRKISQLERILDKDIRRERNIILQCVKHTVENDFYMKSN